MKTTVASNPADPTFVSPAQSFSLIEPDNLPSSNRTDLAFYTNANPGQVTGLSAGTGFDVPFLTTPTRNATFIGFDGSFILPANFPTTTFDNGVFLVVTANVAGVDPPPPLAFITTVPEPFNVSMLIAAGFLAAPRAHRPHRTRGRV
jgi:hypothetical protein